MTQKFATKRTTFIATALAAITIALSLAATSQAHDVLATVKEKYACQKRDYHKAYLGEVRAIKVAYRDSLSQAAAAHRVAVRLCEPNRTLALAQIRAAKLEAAECYRRDLKIARTDYRLALAELEAWYATACRPHHHNQYVLKTVTVPVMPQYVPQYVVRKTTTYHTVPTTVTTTVPAIAPEMPTGTEFYPNAGTHTSGHASEWELISPEARGPVLEAPTYQGPAIEGPVFEGPVLEAPTHPIGPAIEGPVFPQPTLAPPTTTIEVLPPNAPRPTSRPTHRPAYTTKGVKVTTARPTPAVRVVPVSYGQVGHSHRGHGHGHHDLAKHSRSATVGNLVMHALRALAQ